MEKDPKLKNFLFIIPHPDDEIVGVCSIIKKLIGKNNKICLFFLTNGIVPQKSFIFSTGGANNCSADSKRKLMASGVSGFSDCPTSLVQTFSLALTFTAKRQ